MMHDEKWTLCSNAHAHLATFSRCRQTWPWNARIWENGSVEMHICKNHFLTAKKRVHTRCANAQVHIYTCSANWFQGLIASTTFWNSIAIIKNTQIGSARDPIRKLKPGETFSNQHRQVIFFSSLSLSMRPSIFNLWDWALNTSFLILRP